MKILALNGGSSSIKAARCSKAGRRDAALEARLADGHGAHCSTALPAGVDAVGHRIVHGGRAFVEHA